MVDDGCDPLEEGQQATTILTQPAGLICYPRRRSAQKTLDMFFEGTDRSGIDDHYDTAPAARDALCRAEEEATTRT
jgi:hypothetical protein